MLCIVDANVHRLRYPVVPLEFDIFDHAGSEPVAPARVDHELPADSRVLECTFTGQAGFLEQLARRCLGVRFSVLKTACHRLPEVEWFCTSQQQYLAIVGMDDHENG